MKTWSVKEWRCQLKVTSLSLLGEESCHAGAEGALLHFPPRQRQDTRMGWTIITLGSMPETPQKGSWTVLCVMRGQSGSWQRWKYISCAAQGLAQGLVHELVGILVLHRVLCLYSLAFFLYSDTFSWMLQNISTSLKLGRVPLWQARKDATWGNKYFRVWVQKCKK